MRWLSLILLVACSGGGSDNKDGGTTPSDTSGSTDDTTDTTDSGSFTYAVAQFDGVISDAAGAPMSDVQLKLCRGLQCRNGATDGSGAFTFDDVQVDWYSFEAVPPEGYATLLVPLQFTEDQERSLAFVMHELDATSPMPSSATEVEMGEGLHITLSAGVLEPPLFVDPSDTVAGVRVPAADWLPMDAGGTVIDMWYVAPFDHHATNDGLPVRFDNLWGLKDGVSYEVWVGSYEDSEWLNAGSVTVSGAELSGDAKLPLLSTMGLVAP